MPEWQEIVLSYKVSSVSSCTVCAGTQLLALISCIVLPGFGWTVEFEFTLLLAREQQERRKKNRKQ